MFRPACFVIFAALLPGSALAAPIELAPSSSWNLSYDMEACRLGRYFGEGDEKVVVLFSRFMPGPGFEVIISGKSLEPRGRTLEYRFAPGDEPGEAKSPLFGRGDDGMTAWQFTSGLVPHAEFAKMADKDDPETRTIVMKRETERAGEVRSFEILKGVKQPVSLQIGSLGKAMEAMDTCMDDLVREWGYDPDVHRGLLSRPEPKGDPGRWITSSDYPTAALRKALSGSVRFRVGIDETGAVDGCTIQQAYSDPGFREATCKLIEKRGRFTPAIGADGAPARSFWGTTVLFVAG